MELRNFRFFGQFVPCAADFFGCDLNHEHFRRLWIPVLQPLPSDERTKECPRRKPKYRRLPPLPRDDFKVIVRPHQGLSIKSLTSPRLADAVITACGGLITGEQFLLRIKPGSNIFIISTPHQEIAEKVSRIASLMVNAQPHAVNAYVATGEGATRSVIHGLQPHTPSEEIKANHRPDAPVCRICGMQDPVPSHECPPKCATCGEDHLTGDRTCKKRLKPLRRKRSRTSNTSTSHLPRRPGSTMTKKQLCWSSSEAEDLDVDWPGLPPASDSHKARAPGYPRSPRPEEVRRADAASPTAPITNNPEYQRIVAENKLLRESLAEIKKELASLKAHQKQTPQKQLRHPAKSISRKRTNDSPSSPASRRPKQADAADIATIHHGESTA
ncbi:hypothetical protein HPB52_005219 [Rhipicephalus sanguineus]|uniref:Uncharacterized protein n=1 Tax=Rhipicephalus sanguineus TaxID=34632 RepID=A0A9D4PKU8_RHISA|nr:hypothetical protein HPB52_005219 [Rhipicephalus sanguineus]